MLSKKEKSVSTSTFLNGWELKFWAILAEADVGEFSLPIPNNFYIVLLVELYASLFTSFLFLVFSMNRLTMGVLLS